MTGRILLLSLIALVAADANAAPAATHWAAVDSYSGFRGWREQLQQLADDDKRFPVSHFCTVVASGATAAPANRYTWAYVHWREAARLYTYGQSNEPMSAMTEFKQPLDLHKDVVATERQVAGSADRVTRMWVADVLQHCAKNGTSVMIRRSK